MASLRALADPNLIEKTFIPLDNLFKKAPRTKIVVAKVVSISKSSVSTHDNQTFDFDYLVIATGSSTKTGKAPVDDLQENLDYYKKTSGEIKEAKKILIVGGGNQLYK